MKAILEFNLPEDKEEFDVAGRLSKWRAQRTVNAPEIPVVVRLHLSPPT